MSFSHERLDVYRASLEFLSQSSSIIESLPRGRSDLVDQLDRAATSIVLNIAEGAGKFAKRDKRRFYQIAMGSVTECAAILDICAGLRVIDGPRYAEGKAILERILAMLVKLCKRMEE